MRCAIRETGIDSLPLYGSISIAMEVHERFEVDSGRCALGPVVPVQTPYLKDYDALGEPPESLPGRWDMAWWGIFLAYHGDSPVGGAIIAMRTPGLDMLEGRDDLAIIWDLRVAPEWRGKGVGSALWRAAEAWSAERGAVEIRVETQDINVPACRFYQAMGCRLLSADPHGYPPEMNEVKLVSAKPT